MCRRVGAVRTVWLRPSSTVVSQVACKVDKTIPENDSHADTTCLERGALVLFDYNCPVNVQGYDPILGAEQYQTVSDGLAYTHPFTGLRYHLIIHQAIHMPFLEHHFVVSGVLCTNGTIVNECPRMYCANFTEESH